MRNIFLILVFLLPVCVCAQELDAGYQAYSRGDYTTAMREWAPLAQQGDSDAQYNLAVMYEFGRGVLKDDVAAAKWYQLSAGQGDARAQSNLANFYANGRGLPQNDKLAAKFYRLSAEQGNASGQAGLAFMYAKGRGLPQSDEQAKKWYRLAAAQGNQYAETALGSAQDRTGSSGLDRIAFKGLGGAIIGGTLGLIGGIWVLIVWGAKRAKNAAAPKIEHLKKTTLPKFGKFAAKIGAAISNRVKTDEERVLEIGDEFFEVAPKEISDNTQFKGLGRKSLTLAEGDEAKQKAIYIRLRAKQLSEMKNPDDIQWDSIDDANANDRKVELDRLETQHENAQAVSISNLRRGKHWFKFWTYFSLPFGAIISAIYGVLAWVLEGENDTVFVIGLILFAIAGFQVSVSVGLAKRRLWGFMLNRVLIYLTCLGFFAPYIEALVEVNNLNADEKVVEQGVLFVAGLIAAAIWFVPNHIYWRKRERWFR